MGIMPSPPHIQMRFFGNKGVGGGGGGEGGREWQCGRICTVLYYPEKRLCVCRTILAMRIRSSRVWMISSRAVRRLAVSTKAFFILVPYPAFHFI